MNPPGGVDDAELSAAVDGRVVVVTGASYGLGEATARRLAAAGATVIAVARTADRLEQLAGEITQAGGTAHPCAADLTDPGSVDALAERVLERHGHVDVLVNNAGKSIRRSLALSFDRPQDFQRTIDINYAGPVRLLLALVPSMCERGQGHLVNVSTIGTRLPPGPRWAAYQASKGAFDTYFRSAAIELRPRGVTATSVYMSLIHTRMSAPTPLYRYLPGQTPEEGAGVISRAIVRRPRRIAPWWTAPMDVLTTAAPGSWEWTMGLAARFGGDTPAATQSVQLVAEDEADA